MSKHLNLVEIIGPALVRGTLVQDKTAAQALGIARSTFWKLVAAGKFHPVKLTAKATRFRSDEIIDVIDGKLK